MLRITAGGCYNRSFIVPFYLVHLLLFLDNLFNLLSAKPENFKIKVNFSKLVLTNICYI